MVRKVYCCVPACKNNSENNPDLAYHYMPRSEHLRKEWLTSIGKPELLVKPFNSLKALQVCSKHFTVDQYHFPGSKKFNTGAVPNIFEPLALTLPAKLSALLREALHNTEDTPASDPPIPSQLPRELPTTSQLINTSTIDLPGTCGIPPELSESSDHCLAEDTSATLAEVTSNIAELRQLLIFKDLDSDNANDCSESNTTELDGEIVITTDEQQEQEDSADADDCAEELADELTTEQLSKIIGMFEKAADHVVEVDPNIARSLTVHRTINNAIRCYREMYETKQVKKK